MNTFSIFLKSLSRLVKVSNLNENSGKESIFESDSLSNNDREAGTEILFTNDYKSENITIDEKSSLVQKESLSDENGITKSNSNPKCTFNSQENKSEPETEFKIDSQPINEFVGDNEDDSIEFKSAISDITNRELSSSTESEYFSTFTGDLSSDVTDPPNKLTQDDSLKCLSSENGNQSEVAEFNTESTKLHLTEPNGLNGEISENDKDSELEEGGFNETENNQLTSEVENSTSIIRKDHKPYFSFSFIPTLCSGYRRVTKSFVFDPIESVKTKVNSNMKYYREIMDSARETIAYYVIGPDYVFYDNDLLENEYLTNQYERNSKIFDELINCMKIKKKETNKLFKILSRNIFAYKLTVSQKEKKLVEESVSEEIEEEKPKDKPNVDYDFKNLVKIKNICGNFKKFTLLFICNLLFVNFLILPSFFY